jgi:hypothetical protein
MHQTRVVNLSQGILDVLDYDTSNVANHNVWDRERKAQFANDLAERILRVCQSADVTTAAGLTQMKRAVEAAQNRMQQTQEQLHVLEEQMRHVNEELKDLQKTVR